MVWNNSHQQSSKEHMKTSVKTQETHLESKKIWGLQKISAKPNFGEDENGDEEKKREEEKNEETYLFFSHLIGLNKEKK